MPRMTADAYLAWEREQPTKHEFFHGDVFAIAGGSPRHNVLCGNLVTALNNALRPRGCAVLTSDQRVTTVSGGRYVYPDVNVVCGAIETESRTTCSSRNPSPGSSTTGGARTEAGITGPPVRVNG